MGHRLFSLQFVYVSAVAVGLLFLQVTGANKPEQLQCSGEYEKIPFCVYEKGDANSNIIVNIPESGRILPTDIPVRDAGCMQPNFECEWDHHCGKQDFKNCKATSTRDRGTDEIGRRLVIYINNLIKVRPHFLMNNLHRSRFDGNCEIYEASFKNPLVADAFHEYHGLISKAADSVKGRGLFIDLHGQKHKTEWIEIGYLLNKRDLNQTEVNADYSSIRGLYQQSDYNFEQILRGNKSLGYYFEKAGYKAVPSPKYPIPGNKGYFSGGYNLRFHSPIWNQRFDGIQIAIPEHLRLDSSKWNDFAKKLAKVILKWMEEHY